MGYCCYNNSDPVGAIALTVVGHGALYSDGVYYEKTYVQGATQYKVVAPPPGATLPRNAVPADAATVTIAGTTYYFYGNIFYKVVPKDGAMGFVTVDIPAGVPTLAALPADVQPQAGRLSHLPRLRREVLHAVSRHRRHREVHRGGHPQGVRPAPLPRGPTKAIALTVPAGTALSVRLAS